MMRLASVLLPFLAIPAAIAAHPTQGWTNPQLRRHAELQAWSQRGDETSEIWLMTMLEDPRETPDLRAAAALELGRAKSAEARQVLAAALKDRSLGPRFAAALGLGEAGFAGVEEPAAKALESDKAWQVRWALALSLGRERASPWARKALERAAKRESAWQVREQAERSLKGYEGGSAAALAPSLADSDEEMRAAAALALSRLGGKESAALISGALEKERDPYLQRLLADARLRAAGAKPSAKAR